MIVALAGGVGGAKLAQGLDMALPAGQLTVVVNTADDFELFGLRICPDLDTVLYTLAGLANPATGWGIAGDTKHTLDAIARYGRDTWFHLGDQDFATHILRTERLKSGASLSTVFSELSAALGVRSRLLPMTDDLVATKIVTADGLLDFQDYFVARRQQDDVLGVVFEGAAEARSMAAALEAIESADLIVICPSNPIVSVGPILAVPGYREALRGASAPVVAVSPIVGGKALKGPADKMLASLGHEVSPVGVARLYNELVDGIVIDETDASLAPKIEALGMQVLTTKSVMGDANDRRRLAEETLAFGRSLSIARVGA
jgi:LPPG:FO 2-phospho-L-lactate transferase